MLYPDSEKRKLFLEKAQRLLLEYSQRSPIKDEDEDDEFEINAINEEADDYELPQELIDALSDIKPMEPYCDDFEREQKTIRSNMSIECCDGDQEEEYMGNIQYLKVFNFKLKHSLAWYLMIRGDNEIILIEQEIEKYSGLLKILEKDEISNVIDTIRESDSPTQALNAVIGKFQLSKYKPNIFWKQH